MDLKRKKTRDYWKELMIALVIKSLNEYEELFTHTFTEMKDIKELGEV